MLKLFAPAKINLYLHIVSQRNDGYHLLDSLVLFADVGDYLTIEKSPDLSLEISGEFAQNIPNDHDNLIIKAAKILQGKYNISTGAAIHLEKNLPISSGIGGGSADAAASFKLLNELWGLNLTMQELADLSLSIGADLPVCIYSQPALIAGIGEKVAILDDFPKTYGILVNPLLEISSQNIYQSGGIKFSGAGGFSKNHKQKKNIIVQLRYLQNDLQDAAIENLPIIADILQAINYTGNVELARMSGSGATCFGLYRDKDSANIAAQTIKDSHPSWWVKSVVL